MNPSITPALSAADVNAGEQTATAELLSTAPDGRALRWSLSLDRHYPRQSRASVHLWNHDGGWTLLWALPAGSDVFDWRSQPRTGDRAADSLAWVRSALAALAVPAGTILAPAAPSGAGLTVTVGCDGDTQRMQYGNGYQVVTAAGVSITTMIDVSGDPRIDDESDQDVVAARVRELLSGLSGHVYIGADDPADDGAAD